MRIGLALKQVEYESILIDFGKGDHQASSFLERSPIGQVPCLEVDGIPVTQSVAILELLEELYPEPRLLPRSLISRARTRMLAEIVNAGIQPLHNGGLNESMRRQLGASNEQIRSWKKGWITRRLRGMEQVLAGEAGPYATGPRVGLADVMLYPQLDRARSYEVEVAEFPKLLSIDQELRARPEFDATRNPPA